MIEIIIWLIASILFIVFVFIIIGVEAYTLRDYDNEDRMKIKSVYEDGYKND